MHDIIYTQRDLYEFACSDFEPTAFNLSMWLRQKTNDKYTVIELELVKDVLDLIKHYSNAEAVRAFYSKWDDALHLHNLNYKNKL